MRIKLFFLLLFLQPEPFCRWQCSFSFWNHEPLLWISFSAEMSSSCVIHLPFSENRWPLDKLVPEDTDFHYIEIKFFRQVLFSVFSKIVIHIFIVDNVDNITNPQTVDNSWIKPLLFRINFLSFEKNHDFSPFFFRGQVDKTCW